jgi:hypothetical protein
MTRLMASAIFQIRFDGSGNCTSNDCAYVKRAAAVNMKRVLSATSLLFHSMEPNLDSLFDWLGASFQDDRDGLI